MLLAVETRGRLEEAMALGPTFSSHVWSTSWLAISCPRTRPSFGGRRWMIAGKKPSMLEKWWAWRVGVGENCLLVREASSRAIKTPRIVTSRAASFRTGGMVITGVFRGRMLDVIKRPATMLPQASRLMGLITAGLFSLIGDRGLNRGCPITTKNTTRIL